MLAVRPVWKPLERVGTCGAGCEAAQQSRGVGTLKGKVRENVPAENLLERKEGVLETIWWFS